LSKHFKRSLFYSAIGNFFSASVQKVQPTPTLKRSRETPGSDSKMSDDERISGSSGFQKKPRTTSPTEIVTSGSQDSSSGAQNMLDAGHGVPSSDRFPGVIVTSCNSGMAGQEGVDRTGRAARTVSNAEQPEMGVEMAETLYVALDDDGVPDNDTAGDSEGGVSSNGSAPSSHQDHTMPSLATAASVEDTVEAQFTCPTCLDLFINPVVLNCGHIYCWLCLSEWKKAKGSATCPQCRTAILNENKALIIDNMIDATLVNLGQGRIAERNEKVADRKDDEAEFKRKEEEAMAKKDRNQGLPILIRAQ